MGISFVIIVEHSLLSVTMGTSSNLLFVCQQLNVKSLKHLEKFHKIFVLLILFYLTRVRQLRLIIHFTRLLLALVL